MMASSNSMLEKILEDFPNCNNQSSSIKNESSSRDLNDFLNCPNFLTFPHHQKSLTTTTSHQMEFTPGPTDSSISANRMNSHNNLPNTSSFFNNDQLFSSSISNQTSSSDKNKMNNLNLQLNKSQNSKNEALEPLDSNSSKGKFGWSTCEDVALPVILRKDEKLVPVRIVESKIIGLYSSYLPWNVFSCINIKSFFITDIEAKLLNEINTLHCDNYYGSERFSSKDVVVSLNDVQTLHSFLETSKKIFVHGLDKCDFLGFVQISGISTPTVIPYITKEFSKATSLQNTQSKSSITSSLSNLSIKKAIANEQHDTKTNSPLTMPSEQLKDFQNDELNSFFMNEDDDPNGVRIDSSSETTFNENSLPELDENNQFDHDFGNQINSSNFMENSLEQHMDSNLISNLVDELDQNLNSFETDHFNNQFDENFRYDSSNTASNFQSTNDQLEKGPSKKKFVPCSLVEDLLFLNKAEKLEIDEWDCSYLKMICIYAGMESSVKLLSSLSKSLASASNNGSLNSSSNSLKLVCLNDVKWDSQLKPITIKETYMSSCYKLSPSNQFGPTMIGAQQQHSSTMNNYLTTNSNVQQPASTNLNHHHNHHKKSHHHYYNAHHHQSTAPPPSSSHMHLHHHPKKMNISQHLSSTKEATSLAYLDNLYNKISSNNSSSGSNNNYVNSSNLTDQSVSTLGLQGLAACNNGENNNLSNNLYQSASNYPFGSNSSSRSHVNNSYSRDNSRLNNTNLSNPQIGHHLGSNLQLQSSKSNYHHSSNSNCLNKSSHFGSSSSSMSNNNNQSNKTQLYSNSILDELTKHFPSNGTNGLIDSLNNLNSLHNLSNTVNNSRNVLNNCNSLNQQQSSLTSPTASSYNYDSLHGLANIDSSTINNNSIVNNSGLSSNRINNLSMINNLGLTNTFNSYQQSLNESYSISTVSLNNVQLKSINIKPSSSSQALLLSEIDQKLFNCVGLITLKFLLENSFNLKLYDCSILHKQAFINNGLFPAPEDKLVLYDDLLKNITQIRQYIIANLLQNFIPDKS